MAGRISHPDDSESDWDSISQPVPQQSPPGISTETNRLQCDEPNLDEGAQLDESSDQEVDATESGTIHDAPETARFAENQTKRELNKRSLSGDSQDLPSLPYDRHRSSPKSQDNKNFCK